jgi:serine/threonine-protein kinase
MITHSADVYAMGALVFRMLTGHVPFRGELLTDIIHQAIRGPRPSLYAERQDLPKALDQWVAHALAVEPKSRFVSVRELWDGLLEILRPDDTV